MTPARILVVEDEAILANDCKDQLERLGYCVLGLAASAEEAILKTEALQPDLILMDIRLRGKMDGISAAAIIHERYRIPVVYLTAYSDLATLERAKITEPYGYVHKPCQERDLRSAIEIGLFKQRTERKYNEELESRVAQRTSQLSAANKKLRREISRRKRLESEVLKISEREQSRIGQDIHDNLGQILTGIGFLSDALAKNLRDEAHPRAPEADRITAALREAVQVARDLSKSIFPVEVAAGGLLGALEDLANRTEAMSRVRCVFRCDSAFQFEEAAAAHLYRIAQEAVNNALKHADPKCITIECTAIDGVPTLRITDDGTGFKLPKRNRNGMGLHILQYRARLIGARLHVSRGEQGGCTVACMLPVTSCRLGET